MTMKKSFVCAVVVVALLLIDVGPLAQAATCNAGQLAPCLPAITNGSTPSNSCCTNLKLQKACLCGFIKNQTLKPYVNSPNARKVLSACGVPYPSC